MPPPMTSNTVVSVAKNLKWIRGVKPADGAVVSSRVAGTSKSLPLVCFWPLALVRVRRPLFCLLCQLADLPRQHWECMVLAKPFV